MTSSEAVSPAIKYSLFIFNLVFSAVGGVFLGIGLYARLLHNDWDNLTGWSTDPAILLITVGGVMFFLCFAGWVGALREHILLLKIFAYGMAFVLILEVAGGVAALVFRDAVRSKVRDKTVEAITKYHETNRQTDLDDAVEAAQQRFKCCGADNARDWAKYNVYYNCTNATFGPILTACGVPPSCCRKNAKTDSQCGYKVLAYPNMPLAEQKKWPRIAARDEIIYSDGCVDAIADWVKDNYLLIGIAALVLCIVQITGICFALSMIDQINFIIGTI